jgi:site-specific recombinase XerD
VDEARMRVRGKGDKERVLPVAEILVDTLCRYLVLERPQSSETNRLFVVLQGPTAGQPMTRAGLRNLFRHRRRDPALRVANAHRFRHTFGADMARGGVRLPVLQKMMGHAQAETTLLYVELSLGDVAAEYERASRRIRTRYQV